MKDVDDLVQVSPAGVLYLASVKDDSVSVDAAGKLKRCAEKTRSRKFETWAAVGAAGAEEIATKAFAAIVERSAIRVESFGIGRQAVNSLVKQRTRERISALPQWSVGERPSGICRAESTTGGAQSRRTGLRYC